MTSNSMKKTLLTLTILILAGCSTLQHGPIPFKTLKGKKNCLINAVGFQDAYTADQSFEGIRWSRVLCMVWRNKGGHATCVFYYKGKIMVYDNSKGSWTIARSITKDIIVDDVLQTIDLRESPMELAKLWAPHTDIVQAYFMEDLDR